jgi:hypothetical protein
MLAQRERRILRRIRHRQGDIREAPMLSASNVHYELADRVQGMSTGGIGAIQLLARRTGLTEAIDSGLHVLKVHQPYHESDHVLNIAYNALCGGTCLEDIELRRNDEVYLDALGAERIPDPTTAGDFCRRFDQVDVHTLMDSINEVRVDVWQQAIAGLLQPREGRQSIARGVSRGGPPWRAKPRRGESAIVCHLPPLRGYLMIGLGPRALRPWLLTCVPSGLSDHSGVHFGAARHGVSRAGNRMPPGRFLAKGQETNG